MKKKNIFVFGKFLLTLLICLSFFLEGSFARYQVDSKIETIFNSFVAKLEKKYDTNKEIIFLEGLNQKIVKIFETKKLTTKHKKVFKDLLVLSNEKIFELSNKKSFRDFSQKVIELGIVKDLRNILAEVHIPSYAKKLESNNKRLLRISQKQEFVENNDIKRLLFTSYFEVDSKNVGQFKSKSGYILVNPSGSVWFVENAEIIEKIPYSQASQYTKGFIQKAKSYFKRGDNFYSYNFKNFTYLDDKYGFYLSDLEANSIKVSDAVLYLTDNNRFNFITKYSEVKLISDDLIYGITDKREFLSHLVNDKLYLDGDTDELFNQLQKEILILVRNLNQKEKIEKIYSWVLNKIEYTKDLDINDKKIFSGILTYQNRDGVCEGYVKLGAYALMFAGVPGTEVIRGDVVDAQDFPRIGHAWLKIGSKYYDPTFDDPIGLKETRSFEEYKFFGLPRDLFYANRFDYGITPEALKTKSIEYRTNFINQRLSKLADKYEGKDYALLKSVKFNKSSGLKVGEKITVSKAKDLLMYREVIEKSTGELIFYENGKKKNITKLQYFVVDDNNISKVFEQRNYDTTGLYLFNWNKIDGTTEYRMGFDVIIK